MNENSDGYTIIGPQPGPQRKFLASPADIAIYGGAAGGGKTFALMYQCVPYLETPGFNAVIFRRTFAEVHQSGGLWDKAVDGEIFKPLNPRTNATDHRLTFESGAHITFAHMQHVKDKNSYKTAEICYIGFDQLEEFEEEQFWYLLSRNRSLCGVNPFVRGTVNPKPDSWIKKLCQWWIGEDGYAIPERSGLIRFMGRGTEDEILWADSREEFRDLYPNAGEPTSFTFILSTLYDNKILMDKDKGYENRLKRLPRVDRERLLGDAKRGGNWHVVEDAGSFFDKRLTRIVDAAPNRGVECIFWDLAATEYKQKKGSRTSGTAVRMVDGIWYFTFCTAFAKGPGDVEEMFLNITKQRWNHCHARGIQFMVGFEQEPGSAAKREAARLIARLPGMDVKAIPSTGDKLERAKGLTVQNAAGNVRCVADSWTGMLLDHWHNQPALLKGGISDIMDSGAGAFNRLAEGVISPSVSIIGDKHHALESRVDDEIEKALLEMTDEEREVALNEIRD